MNRRIKFLYRDRAIDQTTGVHRMLLPDLSLRLSLGDFDNDGDFDGINWNANDFPPPEPGPLTVDINAPDTDNNPVGCLDLLPPTDQDELVGFDDWQSNRYNFREDGDSAEAPINPVTDPEPSPAEIMAQTISLNVTDLEITKEVVNAPVEVGSDARFRLTVTNNGPNPAVNVQIVDTLSGPGSRTGFPADCERQSDNTIVCYLGSMANAAWSVIEYDAGTSDACSGGLPQRLTNTASVENVYVLAGPDPVPSNDVASSGVTAVDSTGPEISALTA